MSQIQRLGVNDPFPDPRDCPDPDPNVPDLIAVSERIYPGFRYNFERPRFCGVYYKSGTN